MMGMRPSGERRSAPIWVALALFVLGTNYCLLGSGLALAGGHAPACHAAQAQSMAGEECCHAGAREDAAPAPQPAKMVFPCCILLTPPSAVSVDPGPTSAPSPILEPFITSVLVEQPASRWLGHSPDGAIQHPREPERAPLGSRAPPLA